MDFNLRDIELDYSPLAQRLRWLALIAGIASDLLIVPVWILAFEKSMVCASKCAPWTELALRVILPSPLLLLIAAISGIVTFKHPSWGLLVMTLVPPIVITVACIITGVF